MWKLRESLVPDGTPPGESDEVFQVIDEQDEVVVDVLNPKDRDRQNLLALVDAYNRMRPYESDVGVAGASAPKCEQIDDLIKLLVTIRHRWGNTAIRYRVQWGVGPKTSRRGRLTVSRNKLSD